MPIPSETIADKTFGQIESEASRMYRAARKDIIAKMNDFTRHHKAKDKEMQRGLKKGTVTQAQYQQWLKGQVFIGNQWKSKKASIDATIANVMNEASAIVHDKSKEVFAENANHTAYEIEQNYGGAVNFNLYDKTTVDMLLRDDPELLIRKTDADGNKLEAWNTKTIDNAISQGIIQGESINQISQRIARDLCIKADRSTLLYARTAMTCAQNAGRLERMKDAENAGISILKVWIATMDERTRSAHQQLDGKEAPVNQPFDSELGPIDFPGDPNASEANVWNCRCALGYNYKEYQNTDIERTAYYEEGDPEYDPDHRKYEVVKNMTYAQWVNYKQDQIRQRYSGEAKAPTPETKPQTGDRISVSSDAELEAMRQRQKEYDSELEAIRKEGANLHHEKYALDSELRELRRMESKLDDPNLRMFDTFQTPEEFRAYQEQVSQECKELQDARAAIQRPRREDYSTDEAYEAAWDKYREQKDDINDLLQEKYTELKTAYDYRWSDIEDYREVKALGREGIQEKQEELERKKDELDKKVKENDEKANKLIIEKNAYNEAKLIDWMKDRGVEYREPESNLFSGTKPTTGEIVERIAGGDMTSGSCASVGLCYIGQKDGWDVLDFRGGKSLDFFAGGNTNLQFMQGVAQDVGKPLMRETTNTWTGGAVKLARQMIPGQEYYFATARHASIMRVTESGAVESLELQSGWRDGWRSWGQVSDRAALDRMFHSRFGSSKSISGDAYMMNIEDMKDSKLLHRAYGYMNTAEDQQKKGASGHER